MAINIFINGPIGFPPGGVAGEEGTLLPDVRRQYEARNNSDSTEEVQVFINSPGGDVDEGFAIYDYLDTLPNPVTTIGEGRVFSIASVIFLAGQKRLMAKNASLLIHNPLTGIYGEAGDMEKAAAYLKTVGQKIANLYATKTGQPIAELQTMMDAETILNAGDSVTMGFSTALYEPEMKAVAWSSQAVKAMANPKDDEIKDLRDRLKAWLGMKNEAPAEPEPVATPEPEPVPAAQPGPVEALKSENETLKARIAELEADKEKAGKDLEAVNSRVTEQGELLKALNAKLEEMELLPLAPAKPEAAAPAPRTANNKKALNLPPDLLALEAKWEQKKARR